MCRVPGPVSTKVSRWLRVPELKQQRGPIFGILPLSLMAIPRLGGCVRALTEPQLPAAHRPTVVALSTGIRRHTKRRFGTPTKIVCMGRKQDASVPKPPDVVGDRGCGLKLGLPG